MIAKTGNPTSTTLPAGLIIRVTDSFGHMRAFGYDANGHVVTMSDPAGGIYHYTYDSYSNLTAVTYPSTPDSPTGAVRQYKYAESANSPFTDSNYSHQNVLTGIVDENMSRFATFRYDALGRAIASQHAGGVGATSISYTVDTNNNVTSSVVTDPLGTSRTYPFQTICAPAIISSCGAGT